MDTDEMENLENLANEWKKCPRCGAENHKLTLKSSILGSKMIDRLTKLPIEIKDVQRFGKKIKTGILCCNCYHEVFGCQREGLRFFTSSEKDKEIPREEIEHAFSEVIDGFDEDKLTGLANSLIRDDDLVDNVLELILERMLF